MKIFLLGDCTNWVPNCFREDVALVIRVRDEAVFVSVCVDKRGSQLIVSESLVSLSSLLQSYTCSVSDADSSGNLKTDCKNRLLASI